MSTSTVEVPSSPVARRTRTAKAPKATSPQKSRKVSFYLSDSALKRLGVHAAMEQVDKSSVVESLILSSLKTYIVQTRGRSGESADSGDVSDIGN
jgi:hypothetical protein